ncbi:GntR family transcriptional regulator [Propionivibrio dicarboxylicus]|uniref:DNA-binding transcriptional regulator, GntR family n=1 Tax=Propionivibrio dicarboxylicus TaxID=83767 RepID=A0A1G8KKR9_9RHOO|nr:GntR family transcriptional regulator [Propionivibrio dicarboxylicus]SDI43966.1 DNA-binding transcriptional regulator, GntR family [Propionivibrio dicarboxylicus]
MKNSPEVKIQNFLPQESQSIGSQLHRLLRAAIIEGELLPGQIISEIEMSKRFDISRQPVREAFIKLAEERLVEVRPQRGTFVRKISVKEVLDARHLREIIEVSIVREVSAKHDAELINRLRQLITQQKETAPGDAHAFLELDEEMHRTIALHAGREYAWRVTESIKAQMNRVRFLSFDFAQSKFELAGEHAAIVDAIEAGNADLAAQLMEKHLRGILATLPRVVSQYPDYFTDN